MTRLTLTREGVVAVLTLDAPDRANAIDMEFAREFGAAIADAEADPSARVLLLESRGALFCAGGDVRGIAAVADPGSYVRELARSLNVALLAQAASRLPMVCAVQGAAAGAGLALTLNADIVVASEAAVFLSAYGSIGASPDGGTSYLLPRVVGTTRATEMCLGARRLDAAAARDWGIVSEVVAASELETAARAAASRVARLSAEAVTATKRLLASSWLPGYAEHLEAEALSISTLMASQPSRELQERFLLRRET